MVKGERDDAIQEGIEKLDDMNLYKLLQSPDGSYSISTLNDF